MRVISNIGLGGGGIPPPSEIGLTPQKFDPPKKFSPPKILIPTAFTQFWCRKDPPPYTHKNLAPQQNLPPRNCTLINFTTFKTHSRQIKLIFSRSVFFA